MKGRIWKTVCLTAMFAAFWGTAAYGENDGQWRQNAGNGAWYYDHKETGQPMTDFQMDNGKWYFLSTAEDGTKGQMLTGLQWIGHKLYYLNPGDGGAVAFDMDFGGYHFGKYGAAVNEIGNPLLMGDTGFRSRIGSGENLDAPREAAPGAVPIPDVNEHAEALAIYRENFYGSAVEELMTYFSNYGYMPLKEPVNDRLRSKVSWTVQGKICANVFYRLAGLELPFPEEWNENAQDLYDWFVDFYESFDWKNASDYEKAYKIYTWLGERYQFGAVDHQKDMADHPGTSCYMTSLVRSPQLVCEDFAGLYYVLADSVGLDAGFCGYVEVQNHVFNLVRIDGVVYCADASGYAKYGKKDGYFGIFENMFFYDISDHEGTWDHGPVHMKPMAERFMEQPMVDYTH